MSMTRAELGTSVFCLSKKAEEVQSFADFVDKNGMKMFHDALKRSGTTLMTDKDVVLNTINDNTTNILPQVE